MDERRTERLDAASGILFVVLSLFSGLVAGTPPAATDSFTEIQEFWIDEREALQGAAFFAGLAAIAFLWFLGTLRSRLRRAEGAEGRLTAVAFGSGIALLVLVLAASAAAVAPSLHADALDVGDVRIAYDLQAYLGVLALFPVAGLAAAVGAVILRTGALPRWLGIASAAVAAVAVLAAISVYGEDDGLVAIGGGAVGIAIIVFYVWVVVVSVVLMLPGFADDGQDAVTDAPPGRQPAA